MGVFPDLCRAMSRFAPVSPLLSQFFPVLGPKKDKRGQTGTKQDIVGPIGNRPPFRINPLCLALLEKLQKKPHVRNFSARNSEPEMAAPISWAPVISWFFLLNSPHAHKIPQF